MLVRAVRYGTSTACRAHHRTSATTSNALKTVPVLPDTTVTTFRSHALERALPALVPRGSFVDLPAVTKWFVSNANGPSLNHDYLNRFGSIHVPLEVTDLVNGRFARIEQPFSFFLDASIASRSAGSGDDRNDNSTTDEAAPTISARIYLAQAAIADLPPALRADVPIPDLVTRSGRGDVYGSSVWLGQAPTDTPLHRDPNPNLLVQLAGTKVVRLLPPPVGLALFERVREEIVRRGAARASMAAAAMRGDEMMQGPEKSAFEREVWGGVGAEVEGLWEVELGAGDGLFIPLGWWHSVKGVGEGMTGSVNWWFR